MGSGQWFLDQFSHPATAFLASSYSVFELGARLTGGDNTADEGRRVVEGSRNQLRLWHRDHRNRTRDEGDVPVKAFPLAGHSSFNPI